MGHRDARDVEEVPDRPGARLGAAGGRARDATQGQDSHGGFTYNTKSSNKFIFIDNPKIRIIIDWKP